MASQDAKSLLLFHAELEDEKQHVDLDPRLYSTFLTHRPASMEESAISLITRLSAQYPSLRTHIVHLSTSSALPLLQDARDKQKLPLSVETCIHYLTLESEKIPDGRTDYKCCPPIRGHDNREALWQALQDGDIDFIVSDHSPCVAELKRLDKGDFLQAWGGIGGLGLGLSLLYTETQKRGISLGKLVDWLAVKPAKQVGIADQKGSLKVGADGDFVVFDTSATYQVSPVNLVVEVEVNANIQSFVDRKTRPGLQEQALSFRGHGSGRKG